MGMNNSTHSQCYQFVANDCQLDFGSYGGWCKHPGWFDNNRSKHKVFQIASKITVMFVLFHFYLEDGLAGMVIRLLCHLKQKFRRSYIT